PSLSASYTISPSSPSPIKISFVLTVLSTHVCCHCLVATLYILKLLPEKINPCCEPALVHSSSITQLSSMMLILLSPPLVPFGANASQLPTQKSNWQKKGSEQGFCATRD